MRGYFVKNIGQNRGKPRIWLQNQEVSAAGLKAGDRFDVHLKGGTVTIRANPDGSRVVSGKENKATGQVNPIIDINSQELLALFDGMSAIRLVQREGEIYLLPLATELRKKERSTRLKQKMANGEPLLVGSLSHGGGLLANAVHEGLSRAGIQSKAGMVNEIRPELLEHSEGHSGVWADTTIPVAAPMQEFAFDDAATRHIPKHEIMEAGLPCSGASTSGRAKRGTAKAEDHPLVGHLVVAALVILSKANPAVILLENVVPYASTASASILRNQLRDMGYSTHETVLKGADFNALEHRDRWCMVAVTEGMHFSWDMLQMPEKQTLKLSDILDDIPDDDPSWSQMTGLKAKQERDIAAGKGFRMQTFGPEDTKIATMTKGMAKNRSTDPKIKHPSNPDLLRIPTPAEHARVKQYPPSIVEGLSKTLAHEILGQAVLREPFAQTAGALAESIKLFAFENGITDMSTLVNAMANEVTDTAGMVVSEIRQPLAGVIYEGPVTVNDLGMVIQDIGNGVGILHRQDSLQSARLGEVLKVCYPSVKSQPVVDHLDAQAFAMAPMLKHIIDMQNAKAEKPETDESANNASGTTDEIEINPDLFDAPNNKTMPRMG